MILIDCCWKLLSNIKDFILKANPMMSKNLTPETLKDLLESQKKKGSQLRNIENESYQEYRFHNLDHLKTDMLQSLLHISQQEAFKSSCFDNLLKKGKDNTSSLISFCQQLVEVISSERVIQLSHKSIHSQSILLALCIGKETKSKKVQLVTCEESLRGNCHFIGQDNEVDRVGFSREVAEKEGIKIHDVISWEEQCWPQNGTLILDLFGLTPLEYRPFLLKHEQKLSKMQRIILYHSHLQDLEVAAHLLQSKSLSQALQLQLAPEHPIELIVEKNQQSILENLIAFLAEDSERPEKQDAVIFVPVDTPLKRFSTRFAQQLSRHHLRDAVVLITKPGERIINSKNHIFLVNSTHQLLEWDYDLSSLFYVIDFQTEASFRFDYDKGAYVQYSGHSSGAEKARRIAMVGTTRIGRYVSLSSEVGQNLHYVDQARELSGYILKMAHFGLSKDLEFGKKRVADCFQLMQAIGIIKRQGEKIVIQDSKVVEAAKAGINPIEAKLVLNIQNGSSLAAEQKLRSTNLLIMALIVFHTEGTLRHGKQQLESVVTVKPNGVWRKSGYLESCLEILTKYELIESRKTQLNSKSKSFRKKTSKINECEYDVFGCLFEIVEPKKKGFEEMDEQQFLRVNTVNQDLFLKIKDEIDEYRSALAVDKHNIIFQTEDLYEVIRRYLGCNKGASAIYSGVRRQGYKMGSEMTSIFPDKKSLMSQLNQRPECLLVARLSCSEGKHEILMANSFNSETYLEIYGKLPARRSESQSDLEVQFHGISNSTFEQLWKNNGQNIVRFENDFECFVEPNQQMAMIMIHCRKEKQQDIKSQFEIILAKIREKLSQSNKIIHYLGSTSISLGSGGAVQQIMQTGYIDKCTLGNLHLEVSKTDLEELFQDLFVLKDIQVHDPEPGKYYKSATLTFNSQRDYHRFHQCFHQCLYYDRLMDVKPITEENSKRIVKASHYIEFRWFVWRSHRKALVKFQTGENATKAYQSLQLYPVLDEAQVKVALEDKDIIIENLNTHTDEICIKEAMGGFGQVKEVQILKTPLKELASEQFFLEGLIKEVIARQPQNQQNQNVAFQMEPIEKSKGGMRVCRVKMPNLELMNIIAQELNKTIGKLGEGRLYAQTWFEMPIVVPPNSMSIYQQIFKEVMEQAQNPNITSFIVERQHKVYLMLKCPIKQTLDIFYLKLINSLNGYPITLSEYQRTIILSEIGIANILDLEEKFHCKLIVNEAQRTLHALVSFTRLNTIKAEITARVQDHFFYRLSLNKKAFKHFASSPQKLKQIQSTYILRQLELQTDTMALLLQGSALNVQKAFNYLMHFIESLTVPQQEMINADVCGICCAEPHRPYRLQNCCHKFCRGCLLDYINTVLGDNTMFPIKCPHCFKEVVIDDLDSVLQEAHWNKVLTLATNQYLTAHADVMTFCFNAGCKQINMIKHDHIDCDVCLGSYCIECKNKYHPGITCQEAKSGGDQAFKKYMKQNGVRQCPNQKCKIPVIRIDGCYRVTCSRCQKSMCFKCQPEKMIAYDNYTDCYNHLNKEHGGYW